MNYEHTDLILNFRIGLLIFCSHFPTISLPFFLLGLLGMISQKTCHTSKTYEIMEEDIKSSQGWSIGSLRDSHLKVFHVDLV